jgi:hypothetical protein
MELRAVAYSGWLPAMPLNRGAATITLRWRFYRWLRQGRAAIFCWILFGVIGDGASADFQGLRGSSSDVENIITKATMAGYSHSSISETCRDNDNLGSIKKLFSILGSGHFRRSITFSTCRGIDCTHSASGFVFVACVPICFSEWVPKRGLRIVPCLAERLLDINCYWTHSNTNIECGRFSNILIVSKLD